MGTPIDVLTLSAELEQAGAIQKCGGREYIFELMEAVASSANVEWNLQHLRSKYVLRQLIKASDETIKKSLDATYSPDEVLQDAEKNIFAIADQQVRQSLQHIEKFVTFDFAAVTDVVDDVGGIEVDVTQAEYEALNSSRWPTIPEVARLSGKEATYVTKPGLQTLNGVQACAYCRIRHTSDGKGDYGRAQRQRKVMNLVMEKVKKASLSQLNSIIDDVLPKVSTNFSATEILSLATAAKSYSMDKSFGFPFDKWNGTMNTYGSIIVPCTLESNVEKLHQKMFDEMNFAPSQEVRNISQQISYRTGKTEADVEDFSKIEGNIGVDDDTAASDGAMTDTTTGE